MEANWHHLIFKRICKFQIRFSIFQVFYFWCRSISMWLLCSYRINLNISCWLIKKLSSKYNTSINLMTYFFLLYHRASSSFYPRKVALVWYVAVLGYLYLPRPSGKNRDQNPGPKLWRFRKRFGVGIRTFPNDYQHRWLFIPMVTNGHRPVEVHDTDRYQWPTGNRPAEADDTDRYQWPPGYHWGPMVVSAPKVEIRMNALILHRVGEKLRVP